MQRRQIILTAITVGAGIVSGTALATRAKPTKPALGDVLVHAFGKRSGDILSPADVGCQTVFAFAMGVDGTVKSGSLHNQVTLLKLDEGAMSEKTKRFATGPYVAISSACTHTGCEVSGWLARDNELECPCHGSRFDVLNAARVVNGPATKPLAYLPIELRDERFYVTGRFSRRVGPEPTF
ncbi:MAG: ubiquinol-cytochrome c reductase iron-sulfur subunit [Pseudomonadales bacterium]|jgi:nitrite reductase/ring-hydroxylating ferredoxin subunit|nr:ubiquinol-cytochrome c reductase iron-sulfur subunit [Pseudomonadales bacterium]MDP6469974.1 ubiquinol-cytochrome c reductase iron-sulfur subunit [Pseudomonadales bacterium]MDP6829142.1 ubiquinol-cytochrome c reductase iron-sulfur subunit [Pseudomonadales bacterium]|tara:strand:+ start:3205 stop:3747 length:543 start_codon:yes stop_codon:yes gene_type:complete